jgi:hypothetical protein
MVDNSLNIPGIVLGTIGLLAIIFIISKQKSKLNYVKNSFINGPIKNFKFYTALSFLIVGISLIIVGNVKENYGYSYTEEAERDRMKNDIYQLDKF